MRGLISSATLLLLTASPLFADPRYDAAVAQRRLEDAEARLRHCDNEYSYVQVRLYDSVALRNGALQSYDAVALQANDASANIASTSERIDQLAAKSQSAAARAEQLKPAFEDAKKRADAAGAEVEKYRAPLIAAFESSPEFDAAAIKLQVAGESHDAEVEAAMEWLCATEPYAVLYESS